MKRGGLFLAACLLVSGALQFTSPRSAGSNSAREGSSSVQSSGSAQEESSPENAYAESLNRTIQGFFADRATTVPQPAATSQHGQAAVPLNAGEQVKSVIAILPDPAHTHLGLFFDRSIEALQQGVQAKGFVFDRAVMPWVHSSPNEKSDYASRSDERAKQRQSETFPGLLIFRSGTGVADNAKRNDLFVLVVGETPTAGLNKQQFHNALQLAANYGAPAATSGGTKPKLLILGPTFSGSLESLEAELRTQEVRDGYAGATVYSGTVTSAGAMETFTEETASFAHFASFQENDDYARARFLQFVCDRGYEPQEIAILSEDETVYGSVRSAHTGKESAQTKSVAPTEYPAASARSATRPGCREDFRTSDVSVVNLHFPREISYFRSAYQKEANGAAPPSNASVPTLPMDLEDGGADDDSVPPYAVAQTSLSQESVMLGIVSELQKHRIKFTMLLATDPLDELFLATYLRRAYAQGQVIISVPDLLFAREAAPDLRGVLSLNSYSLIPGLSDRLCRQKAAADVHRDRLFVSSGNVGTFNAMVGLLSESSGEVRESPPDAPRPDQAAAAAKGASASELQLPDAPYAEYGSPSLVGLPGQVCQERPLLWLTILGRDGFWPVVGLSDAPWEARDRQLPLAFFDSTGQPANTLQIAMGNYSLLEEHDSADLGVNAPSAWKIAYGACLLLLILHVVFSFRGNVLADSETLAQFARSMDGRGHFILAIGAAALTSAFVLTMCSREALMAWTGGGAVNYFLWLPFPLFVGITFWDLRRLRRMPGAAVLFTVLVVLTTLLQMWLTWRFLGLAHVFWSARMLFLSSGVSPITPVLLLLAAAYFWMWMSLRGVCLVDLRRPRLPDHRDLPPEAYRISDEEAEKLRETAHPFFFAWQVMIPLILLVAVLFAVLDRRHPVQTIEGWQFDWGYTLLLGLIVGTFLGCLFKLVRTWLKCRQVLAGLDRLPLRAAFGRMKDLSWHSFWNPGGSSLRTTYKVMQRATENQTHLLALVENWNTPMPDEARRVTRKQIRATIEAREALAKTFSRVFHSKERNPDSRVGRRKFDPLLVRLKNAAKWARRALSSPRKTLKALLLEDFKKGCLMNTLLKRVEMLQKEMARTAGVLAKDVLSPLWVEDGALAVSTDERVPKPPLPLYRAMAEEYTALVYVNFLVSVLLRIRTLVICAGGLYVLIVLSLNTYPFEPHPALQTLAVLLILAMGAMVGYVYAEMHRDGILSYLTSTTPGELGLDFWVKFLSAGAIPVFSLLAAQFPSINQFLFSWLEPALQALK